MLIEAKLIRRYKRFLADVEFEDSVQTVHCPNTGSMTGCAEQGSRVWLSRSTNPKRKLAYTWELVESGAGDLICVHSALANKVVNEALSTKAVTELSGYDKIQPEVKWGDSRIDFLLSEGEQPDCYVEVKSVTLYLGDGLGAFPDAPSERGRRHLENLISIKQQGLRAALLFCVQHTGIHRVQPADDIDPDYGEILKQALAAGVEVLAYATRIDNQGISIERALEFLP